MSLEYVYVCRECSKEFDTTDQNSWWFVKCPGCGSDQCACVGEFDAKEGYYIIYEDQEEVEES